MPKLNRLVSFALTALLMGQGLLPALAASTTLTGDIRVTVDAADLKKSLPIKGGTQLVTMAFRDISVTDALRALARKGGFNIAIDESVTGQISVDLNNVTVQDALETLKTYGNLAYSVQNDTLMVANAESEKGRAFQRATTRILNVKHANVRVLAEILNRSLFSDRMGSAGNNGSLSQAQGLPVTPDFHTNSLIVMGTPHEVEMVAAHVRALDMPREMKTWRLSHSNALDVASMLSSSLFNEGQPPLVLSSGGGASGGGGGGGSTGGAGGNSGDAIGMPSSLRVTAESISEGDGASQTQDSSSGSSEGSGIMNAITLRARLKESQMVQVSPQGAILLPDTRLNTLTLLGTAEQIAMAEALIPTMDRKLPQVVLEASLVELTDEAIRELGFKSGFTSGKLSFGSSNNNTGSLVNAPYSNDIGRLTDVGDNVLRLTSNPVTQIQNFFYQLNALDRQNKAKILANPTVITTHDNETTISIVDEILKTVTVTSGTVAGQVGTTAEIGNAGIVLNMLPKVGADNTISLRVRPVVTAVSGTITDNTFGLITLLSKREVLAQNVVLQDGESFILGGLIQQSSRDIDTHVPGLSNLPIVGAMLRNADRNRKRTELVVIITPHILNDESNVARAKRHAPMQPAVLSQLNPDTGRPLRGETGMVPVSYSGSGKKSALPALEDVKVLGGPDNIPESGNKLEAAKPFLSQPPKKPEAKIVPVSNFTPVAAPSVIPRTAPVVSPASSERPASKPVAPVVSSARPETVTPSISDETIRAIMEKFSQ